MLMVGRFEEAREMESLRTEDRKQIKSYDVKRVAEQGKEFEGRSYLSTLNNILIQTDH
jgi:hypothetical protein